MHDHRKRHRTFHVNMLKKWHVSIDSSYWTEEGSGNESDEDDVVVWNSEEAEGKPNTGSQLTTEQQMELQGLLESYRDVFQNKPGWLSTRSSQALLQLCGCLHTDSHMPTET